MKRYICDGPVKSFETVVRRRWKAETMAVSEAKARSNLIYRYKIESLRRADSFITLPGTIQAV